MDEMANDGVRTSALTPARVAASAIQQAARHERALRACLSELAGADEPARDLAEITRRRAVRHAERAVSLTQTAIRLNRDSLAEAFLASLLERHERNRLHVWQLSPDDVSETIVSLAV